MFVRVFVLTLGRWADDKVICGYVECFEWNANIHTDHTYIEYITSNSQRIENLVGKNKMGKNRKSPFPRPEYRKTNWNWTRISFVSSYHWQSKLTFLILCHRILLCFCCYLFIGWVRWIHFIIAETSMECHVPNVQSENPLHLYIPENPIWLALKWIWKRQKCNFNFYWLPFHFRFQIQIPNITFLFSFDKSYRRMIMMMKILHWASISFRHFAVANLPQLLFTTRNLIIFWNVDTIWNFTICKKSVWQSRWPKAQNAFHFDFNEWNQYKVYQ